MLDHGCDTELTVVSLSDEVPAPPERRRSQRNLSVLRTAILRTSTGEELCLVRNISAGGLMAHVYTRLHEGDSATVEFKSQVLVRGHVVWSRERLVGIQFAEQIDVSEVLGDLRDPVTGDHQSRLPRIEVHSSARLRSGGQYQPVLLCNISQGGAKLRLGRPDDLKGDVMLIAGCLPPLPGTVRWHDGEYAGISFNEVIPFADVARWIANAHRAAH